MDVAGQRTSYINQAVRTLALEGGFHPIGLVLPELEAYARLTEHALLRALEDEFYQLILIFPTNSPDALKKNIEEVKSFAIKNPQLVKSINLRISCVGVGPGRMTRNERRERLRPARLLDNRVVVRAFYLSLEERRMFAFATSWGFAPGFEINPCDPDDNLFVLLVRGDRYLAKPADPATETFHRETLARERTFRAGLSGKGRLVFALIAVNVLVWLILDFTGGSTSPAQLIRAGAKVNGLIDAGQFWRFVTPIFLHVGLMHMLLNSVGLFIFGEVLERIYGTYRFALVYFVAGIASVVASYAFGASIMAGASGAVFGLAGALVVYGYRYRRRIPPRFSAMFGGGLLPLIGLNIVLGVLLPGIDNWAHVGGLVAGAGVALMLRPLADEADAPRRAAFVRVEAVVVSGLVAGCFALGVWWFVTMPSILRTDLDWQRFERLVVKTGMLVPASWTGRRSREEVSFISPCYPAMLEARVCMGEGIERQLSNELARLREKGKFVLADPRTDAVARILAQLARDGRAEAAMVTPGGMLRRQLFTVQGGALVSAGIMCPMADWAAFAPIEKKMAESFPAGPPAPRR